MQLSFQTWSGGCLGFSASSSNHDLDPNKQPKWLVRHQPWWPPPGFSHLSSSEYFADLHSLQPNHTEIFHPSWRELSSKDWTRDGIDQKLNNPPPPLLEKTTPAGQSPQASGNFRGLMSYWRSIRAFWSLYCLIRVTVCALHSGEKARPQASRDWEVAETEEGKRAGAAVSCGPELSLAEPVWMLDSK